MWTERGKARLILIFSTNTNCEDMAYRSFRSEKCSARGVRKVTTGITGLWQPGQSPHRPPSDILNHRDNSLVAPKHSKRSYSCFSYPLTWPPIISTFESSRPALDTQTTPWTVAPCQWIPGCRWILGRRRIPKRRIGPDSRPAGGYPDVGGYLDAGG